MSVGVDVRRQVPVDLTKAEVLMAAYGLPPPRLEAYLPKALATNY
jgi:hypothetical protein